VKQTIRSELKKFILFGLIIKTTFGSINLNAERLLSQIIIKSHPINPMNNSDRLSVLYSISSRSIPWLTAQGNHTNIGFGYKISKNLALEGTTFNKPLDSSSVQIISGGVQYFFGGVDTLSWVTSIKKSNYNSIKSYNLNSITFSISKWINSRSKFFNFGFGSSFYKKSDFSTSLIGQINFTYMNILIPIGGSQLGYGLEINQNSFLNSLFIQKAFH
tara:strand:- start:638 stop:1288 length:651 start_codon:yes stop_codon:yes gene_type:complete